MKPKDLRQPDFDGASKVHDWRNHIPEHIEDIWHTFSLEQMEAIYQWAENLANAEEWE